ncbi:hypothetical protein RFI_01058 [Reticulomyxa filosa]|uniref:Uncharacterized protein n=1 Tax=Reticulomyxa filosa TaxID=46433 RepID=X6PD69_RETFI|nr:hypothetical protein RFI_01058 [Reticulomyxa filosa]|eukprot:ETO36004.1 hypothetical protein RFI_01058 [Reticulomyxa filosa]
MYFVDIRTENAFQPSTQLLGNGACLGTETIQCVSVADASPHRLKSGKIVEHNIIDTPRSESEEDEKENHAATDFTQKNPIPVNLKWIEKIYAWCEPKLKQWQYTEKVPLKVIAVIWLRFMHDLQQQSKDDNDDITSIESMLEFLKPSLNEILEQYLTMYAQHNSKEISTTPSFTLHIDQFYFLRFQNKSFHVILE